MSDQSACPECGGASYRRRHIPTGSLKGPILLPGLGSLGMFATVTAVVCGDCGLVRFYADKEPRDRLSESADWFRQGETAAPS